MAEKSLWERILARVGIRVVRPEDLAPRYDSKIAAERRYVFVRNDSVSRMDSVVKWLERSFEMDKKTATLTMYGIHHHGLGVLGPFSTEEAARRLERARDAALELGLDALEFSCDPPVD